MEVSFEDDFAAEEFFDFGEVAIAHRGDFERVYDGEIGFFCHYFDEVFFWAAGVHVGGDAGFGGEVDGAFYGGEGELAEDIDGLEDERA